MSVTFINQGRFRDPDTRAVVTDWDDYCKGHDTLDAAMMCSDAAQKLTGEVVPHLSGIIRAMKIGAKMAVVDMRIVKRTVRDDVIEERLDVLTPVTPKKAEP